MTPADPISWLLEAENAPVRYWTLRDLLDRPAADPEVQAARAAIPTYPPLAELLAAQKPDGFWIKRDYYLPKHHGTFWTLSVLADLGLARDNEQIQRACEFMFTVLSFGRLLTYPCLRMTTWFPPSKSSPSLTSSPCSPL